ncbi:MAG: alanine racemase [Oscillospiraceae bacterium]|jgi:alanine racemase|nr:alanine racemase [Oscillospiraceae bacterium]
MGFHERTWVEVDLKALAGNVAEIRRIAPNKEIIAVVKANAYGHGDNLICTELRKLNVRNFAVSCVDEAVHIKKYVPDSDILIFGFTETKRLKEAAESNFVLTVGGIEYARELSALTSSANTKCRVHIKLNTGMNRVGINTENELEEILALPGLNCEAVYTHFPCADSLDENDIAFTQNQQEKFLSFAGGKGLKVHSQNSGGVLFHENFEADYVRAGLILYGLSPDPRFPPPIKLSPVMSLKSVIHQLRTLEAGDYVSYGRTYRAPDKRLAAVVPVGYADGYSRAHSNSGLVAVKNTLCPVLGRVCMDQLVIDVSQAEGVKTGDEVLLYSADFKETSIEYIAEKLGTIPYEVVCAVSSRVSRLPKAP